MSSSSRKYELVIVSYRSRHQVAGLLAGLDPQTPFVLVDNSGDSDEIRDLVSGYPVSRYLDGGGEGFARAANLGARSSGADHLVFVNPDCRPSDADLETLVADLQSDPQLASSAATTVNADGVAEIGSGGWEPSPRRALVHALGLHKVFPTAGLFARPRPGEPLTVDWTTGACMAVRASTFAALGAFDETFYVYNEDVAFGRTVRAAGLRQRLRTDVLVQHGDGGSGAPSVEMMRLRGASMARYVTGRRPLAAAAAIRSVLAAGYLVRAAQCALTGDSTRAREHLAYVRGVVTARARVGGRVVTDR